MKKTIKFAAAVLIAVLVATPVFAARGAADFTRFVTLGDSITAGFQSSSLNERHQVWSWPAIVARQAGLKLCTPASPATEHCFAQPLISYPGIPNELILQDLSPTIVPAPGPMGSPLMLNFGRPYNNLAVVGASVRHMNTLNPVTAPAANDPTEVTFGRLTLRGLGTPVDQTIAQQPTFIAILIGFNDVLNVVFSGTTATLTPAADFKASYEAMLDKLVAQAPNAGIVVGSLGAILPPYLTLVPPVLVDPATRLPILIGGQPVFYIADNGSGVIAPITSTTLIPLGTRAKLAQGYGLPPQLKNIPPFSFLPHTGEPLSANDVITAEEMTVVFARIAEYNAALTAAASARNIPVANTKGLLERLAVNPTTGQGGIRIGPLTITNAFITGGFFSLDGFHFTDLGELLVANEFIRTINSAYGSQIPLASITQLYANNGAFFPDAAHAADIDFSEAAISQINTMWAQPTMKRGRMVRH